MKLSKFSGKRSLHSLAATAKPITPCDVCSTPLLNPNNATKSVNPNGGFFKYCSSECAIAGIYGK